MTPDRWFDLALNLFTELVGIVVTVFLVDRIIERKEEFRWKPSKHIFHSQLLETLKGLYKGFCPVSILENLQDIFVAFGETSPFVNDVNKDMRNLDNSQYAIDDWLEEIFGKGLETEESLKWKETRLESLRKSTLELDRIVNDAALFLEPELLSVLFRLRSRIEELFVVLTSRPEKKIVFDAFEGNKSKRVTRYHYTEPINNLLKAIGGVQVELFRQATKTRTFGQLVDEYSERTAKRILEVTGGIGSKQKN